jgi:hypothetical protein
MKWLALPGSFPERIFFVVMGLLACALLHAPSAQAQRGAHVGGGRVAVGAPPRVAAPIAAHAPMVRPMIATGVGHPGFVRPFRGFRPFFFGFAGPPFFGYGPNIAFDSVFWVNCGAFWGWEVGCGGVPTYGYEYNYPNYVLAPPFESPVYAYGMERQDRVQLFLKDGTVYNVIDYWFVNGQIHFTVEDESGSKATEQAIGIDELDLQKTIDVNTRRGFRFVMRNEPWQQFLKDHPDETPPPVKPPEHE